MNKNDSHVNVYLGQCVTMGADDEVGGCKRVWWGGGSGWPYDAMFWQQCYETA